MNLKQIEAFVHIAEGKSFSKAAKELFLTQPTISSHIASLEKELNVRLFVRNTKEVNLSPEGEMLYGYAKQMVELEDQIAVVFGKEKKEKEKTVVIAASTVPAQYILPDILGEFCKKYPSEQFQIIETDSAGVVELISNGQADIGFSGTQIEKKFCTYIPFCEDELVIIAPNTEEYQKRGHNISWIKDEGILMREEGSGTRKEVEKQLKAIGIDANDLNIIASIENQEIIKKSVGNGMGISMMSKLATTEEEREGKLLQIPFSEGKTTRMLNLVYNKNHQLSSSANKILKIVKRKYNVK